MTKNEDDVVVVGSDLLTMGTGVAAHFLAALGRRGAAILTGHRATKLIKNNRAVTGVEVETSGGRTIFNGTVILTTGSYDWNFDLVKQYSELVREKTSSVAPPGIRGDGHVLAREIGADIVKLPIDRAMPIPGYRIGNPPSKDNLGFRYGASTMGWLRSMLVDSTGKRFAHDAHYRPVVIAIAKGEGTNPFFLIWYEDHHQRYRLPPVRPGKPYPEDQMVLTAPSLRGLAIKLNIDADNFVASVERVNKNAREGKDPDFKRGENDWAVKFLGDRPISRAHY